jgi:hypothetical protein
MAVWKGDEKTLDWDLVRNGPVTKYFDPVILSEDMGWLEEHGYRVVSVDASRWETSKAMHVDVAAALDFPDYYGQNLNALVDCLRDVVEQDYGWSTGDTGLVFAIHRFDEFYAHDSTLAHALVDIYAGAARAAALIGNRMICLVQSTDPRLEIADVGGTSPAWNRKEWLTKKRIP